jgi:hypothetical protein
MLTRCLTLTWTLRRSIKSRYFDVYQFYRDLLMTRVAIYSRFNTSLYYIDVSAYDTHLYKARVTDNTSVTELS